MRRFTGLFFVVSIVGLSAVADTPEGKESHIAPFPDWIETIEPVSAEDAQYPANNGNLFLLYDVQFRSDGEASTYYKRSVSQLTSEKGVRRAASLKLSYDPTWQDVVLHDYTIVRTGERINALETAHIETLRRETGLSRGMYDGRETLYVRLEDVRVGDVIDYSVSYIGENPAYKGHFTREEWTEWGTGIERQHVHYSWPEDEAGRVYIGSELQTPILKDGRYSVRFGPEATAPKRAETGMPRGLLTHNKIQLTSFENWADVANTATPYFEARAIGPDLQALIDKIKSEHITFEDRMTAATRFVQDDIRYQAITLGIGGWQPNPTDTILSRRFGDCKDKSLLLVLMARAFGADTAHVALVHTRNGYGLPTRPPAMNRFNHAIAHIVHKDKTYWIDGTLALQGGAIGTDAFWQPDYKHALILAPGTSELTPMPMDMPETPRAVSTAIFDASAGLEAPVGIDVTIIMTSAAADRYRRQMRSSDRDTLMASIHRAVEKSHGELSDLTKYTVEDDRDANTLTLEWSANLLDPFELPLDENVDGGELTVDAISGVRLANAWAKRRRTTPLDIYEGDYRTITTKIITPAHMNLTAEKGAGQNIRIENSGFLFERDVTVDGNVYSVETTLKTLADYVSAEDARDVFRGIRRVNAASSVTLLFPPSPEHTDTGQSATP